MAGYLPIPYSPTPVPYSPTPTLAQQLGGGTAYGPPAPGYSGGGAWGPVEGVTSGASPLEEVAAAGGGAAGLNRFGQLAARLGVPEEYLAGTFNPGMWGGIAASIAGKPIGGLVGQLTGSQTAGNTTGDVIQYGGLGASLGSLIGPWGAAGGALAGGAYGLYKGLTTHEAPKLQDKAFSMLSGFGVDSQVQGKIRQTYEQLQQADPQTADQWLAGVVQQAGTQFQANNNPFASQTPESNLVLQQLAGQAMAPYVTDMRQNLNAAAKSLTDNMGHNLSPNQAAQLRPLVQQYAALSKNVGDAYALQAESFPIQNALAKSAWSNMIQQASGGGGGGLTALLAQQAASPSTTLGK